MKTVIAACTFLNADQSVTNVAAQALGVTAKAAEAKTAVMLCDEVINNIRTTASIEPDAFLQSISYHVGDLATASAMAISENTPALQVFTFEKEEKEMTEVQKAEAEMAKETGFMHNLKTSISSLSDNTVMIVGAGVGLSAGLTRQYLENDYNVGGTLRCVMTGVAGLVGGMAGANLSDNHLVGTVLGATAVTGIVIAGDKFLINKTEEAVAEAFGMTAEEVREINAAAESTEVVTF